jgi:hypothetical protein
MVPAMSTLHSKATADLSSSRGCYPLVSSTGTGIPPARAAQTALENPTRKKATELVARKARSTHVHNTVASCSHRRNCSHLGEPTVALQSCVHTSSTTLHEGIILDMPRIIIGDLA